MLKLNKKFSMILMFSFVLTLTFVGTPTSASEKVERPAVDTLSAPDSIWTSRDIYGNREPYKFFEEVRHGKVYRGYLGYAYSQGGSHIYSGYLYREDLPYPIPSMLPLPLNN